MGYEIPAGIGVKLAEPERSVAVLIGDGSYLMMNSELVTAVAEGLDLTVVVVDNHGFQSIHGLQRSIGTPHFALELRSRNGETGQLDGDYLAVDYAAHAGAMGARTSYVTTASDLRAALEAARDRPGVDVVVVEVNPEKRVGGYAFGGWWDVPIAEASGQRSVREAQAEYLQAKKKQVLFK